MNIGELKRILSYDPETGIFTWLVNRRKVMPGDIAGSIQTDGYIAIGINGKRYKAHRLAWMYVYGCLPKCDLDHVNHVRSDNRIANLRVATRKENVWNRSGRSKTGFKGVSISKCGTFRASIQIEGKTLNLGSYATPELASAAYLAKAVELFGEFATIAMKQDK